MSNRSSSNSSICIRTNNLCVCVSDVRTFHYYYYFCLIRTFVIFLSGVCYSIRSDFTVRCSNFSFIHATSSKHIERRIDRKRTKAMSTGTHTRIQATAFSPRYASKSRTLFRNAFEIKRDGNNLKRMHAVRL